MITVGRLGNCAGQMTLDFSVYRNPQNDTIKHLDSPRVYILSDVEDFSRIENFKHNFTGIEYRTYYSDKIDYFLIFLSEESLRKEEFLRVFLDINEEIESRKIIGFILDDELRRFEKRLELYEYYRDKYTTICDFKKKNGSNADIRNCGNLYERCFEKVGCFLEETLKNEGNKKVCAEEKFEACLKSDGRKGLRVKQNKERKDISVMEEKHVEEIYYQCNVMNARDHNQINWNAGGENNSINQKSGVEKDELEVISNAIMKEIYDLKEEEKTEFRDGIEEIKKIYKDAQISKDKKGSGNKLAKCIAITAPMLTIANGTPTLLDNLKKLQLFLASHIV